MLSPLSSGDPITVATIIQELFVRALLADPKREHRRSMKRRGLASPDLDDCLAMTFALDIALRSQRTSQVVYQFPSRNAWMENLDHAHLFRKHGTCVSEAVESSPKPSPSLPGSRSARRRAHRTSLFCNCLTISGQKSRKAAKCAKRPGWPLAQSPPQ
jgi:hypothetical protein